MDVPSLNGEKLLKNEDDTKYFLMDGIAETEDTVNEDDDKTFVMENKTIEERPSKIHIDQNVDDLVNQILSPDTAEFINFE